MARPPRPPPPRSTPSRTRPARRPLLLNPLRAFEAAARHLSFTKAADELGVTQGAISRHIRALEERFGFPLFERTRQGIALNHAARIFAHELEDAFARIARATDNLVATQTHSVITVRGYTTFFIRWLIPRLPAFQRAHPEIEIRLVAATDPVDFSRDAVDVGIRYGHGRWPHWRSDLLFVDSLTPVCSKAYLEGRSGQSLLDGSTLLHHNLRPADWPEWLAAAGLQADAAENLHFEDLSIVYECARASLGIAIGQRAYVQADLASGALVAPFEAVLTRERGYYLVCPAERADAPKITLLRDWLLASV